ncbi:putative cytochrome P450 6a14, partial [Pseudolycoriella hygida]
STAFGIEVNTVDNPNIPFRDYGRRAFSPTFLNGLRGFMSFVYPKLQSFIKIKGVDNDIEKFMINLVKDTMEYREKNNISRKDLLQLMIQLRNTGNVQNDEEWDTKIADETKKKLTLNEIAAQAWVFYIAGFETSSSTMSYCLYELAKNIDIQRKVQEEIDEVTARNNGEITYNSIIEMKYLEMCIDGTDIFVAAEELASNFCYILETLRKHPVVPVLNRETTRDYIIPGTNVIIEKGTSVIIPVLPLQRDPKYYPEPEKFIPERFLPDNVKTFEERPYLGFGDGPRACIGLRMGKMQTKVGLVLMLKDYTYELLDKTELKLSAKSFVLQPTSGINLKIIKRIK